MMLLKRFSVAAIVVLSLVPVLARTDDSLVVPMSGRTAENIKDASGVMWFTRFVATFDHETTTGVFITFRVDQCEMQRKYRRRFHTIPAARVHNHCVCPLWTDESVLSRFDGVFRVEASVCRKCPAEPDQTWQTVPLGAARTVFRRVTTWPVQATGYLTSAA